MDPSIIVQIITTIAGAVEAGVSLAPTIAAIGSGADPMKALEDLRAQTVAAKERGGETGTYAADLAEREKRG